MRFANFLDLATDNAIRTAQELRSALIGRRPGPATFLPGAHQAQPIRVAGDAPDQYLRAGPMHRSLWRTIEWRLAAPLCRELPRPVADVGCGDGELGSVLFERADYGIDGDEPSLAHCRGRPTYGAVLRADVRTSLDVPDGSLAAVFSNSTFEHISPVDGALAAVARSLAPGGRFLFTVPSLGLHEVFTRAYGAAFSRRLNATFGHYNLWRSSEWEARLAAAGFSDVATRGYMTAEAAEWFASLHFIRRRKRERRDAERFWESNLARFLRLVRESVEAREEAATTCLLLDARR
jgi:SAM-dependent methyltransferase